MPAVFLSAGIDEVSPVSLYASDRIAAGGIVGLAGIGVKYMDQEADPNEVISLSRVIPVFMIC